MGTPSQSNLLTPAEFGRTIGRSRGSVYRLVRAGAIPVVRLTMAHLAAGETGHLGAVRITRETLEAFASGELQVSA